MPTLFAVPKPFVGHIGLIQSNAIRSWLALRPRCEVILFGDETGISDFANRHAVKHVPELSRNEFGTTLLDDAFLQAKRRARDAVLCYVNADIILLSDFLPSIERVRRSLNRFLMVGCRWDIDLQAPVDFSKSGWEDDLRQKVATTGIPRPPEWIDYFAFNRELFTTLLPFALGRAAFDNWLLWKATSLGAALVDSSSQIMAVHQNHDYSHHPGGKTGVWEGPEAKRNRELMETWDHCFFLSDASHRLTRFGVRPNLNPERFRRQWSRRTKFRRRRRHLLWAILIRTYPIRRRLGLRREAFAPLARLLSRGSRS